jgi:hypothetical protein
MHPLAGSPDKRQRHSDYCEIDTVFAHISPRKCDVFRPDATTALPTPMMPDLPVLPDRKGTPQAFFPIDSHLDMHQGMHQEGQRHAGHP